MRIHQAIIRAVALSVFGVTAASAAPMDIAPERLVMAPGSCSAGQGILCPDNVGFANIVSELGFAIAPPAMRPAASTGYGGFAVSLQATYTGINSGAYYWQYGTEGRVDSTTSAIATKNATPDSVIQIYTLNMRKGLPFGFELNGALGYLADSSMAVVGGDLHWSIFEGFRAPKNLLGFLPDLGVGGGVRTLVGSPKFYLTTAALDVQVSKSFTVADSATLTPIGGYQRLYIYGNSGVVDLTPNIDPIKACGLGPPSPSGQPNCNPGLPGNPGNDFNNDQTFDPVRLHRDRLFAGLQYRYEVLQLAAMFISDLTSPSGGNPGNGLTGGAQWTVALEAGLRY